MPYVAWRDEKISELRAEEKKQAEQLALARKKLAEKGTTPVDSPSFRRYAHAERRINQHMNDRNYPDRGNLVARKLKSYSFARSHGVRIPTIYGIWDSPEDIAWAALPDQVVIKTNTGSASRGVFPLRRTGGGWTIVTKTDPIAPQEIAERLRRLHSERRVGGPFFAEELLGGGNGNTLPVEVRVSAFYGEISHVLLRQVSDHGDTRSAKFRRILVDGTDVVLGDEEPSDGLEIPGNLDELVGVAKRLSLNIPRAYARIDLYDIAGEVVFGELTPRPGNPDGLSPDQDQRLGRLWERAQARLLNDVIDGGDYRLRFGPGPRELQVGNDDVYLPERGW